MATTTTMTAMDLTHPTQVVGDRQVDGLGHRAECGCGWVSAWSDDAATAEAAAVDHREVAAGPGDGLDAVMSELLDLQDGLAGIVVWLAENWSADLPVPIVYGHDGGIGFGPARVKVSACCLDSDELTRIAHLLGVPPVDDERPNSQGRRYRTVRRDFGRVTLHAFHRLPETTERAS
ncbi:MAG TPA: hypothetical protein VFZ68_15735 [Acidimicrobiales bacterium]